MPADYRHKLFASYSSTHIDHLDRDEESKRQWFLDYAEKNYLPLIRHLDRSTGEVLEIACNRGYLLSALSRLGFQQLNGVDLSPDDLALAGKQVPNANLTRADVFEFLDGTPDCFDVIVLKALLEHVPKSDVLTLLEKIHRSLRPNGVVIIDVPNMDWLMAAHERYMDFTHEVGFTRQSLSQLMRNVFSDVTVRPGIPPVEPGVKKRIISWLRPCVVACGKIFLSVVGEGASDVWWHCRAIIGTGRK